MFARDVNDGRVLGEGWGNAKKWGKRPDGAACERLVKIVAEISRKLVKVDRVDSALTGVPTSTLGALGDFCDRKRLRWKERTRSGDRTIVAKRRRFFQKETEVT